LTQSLFPDTDLALQHKEGDIGGERTCGTSAPTPFEPDHSGRRPGHVLGEDSRCELAFEPGDGHRADREPGLIQPGKVSCPTVENCRIQSFLSRKDEERLRAAARGVLTQLEHEQLLEHDPVGAKNIQSSKSRSREAEETTPTKP
jgi:hypothetical protein